MEILDIVDMAGNPTGETVDREQAHAEGIRHRTSHVWITCRNGDTLQILLQKRSDNKDSHPGCYDISSAGHIPAGDEPVPSALRELQEELGVTARPEDLVYCGQRYITFDAAFHGRPFHDRQVTNVYVLSLDRNNTKFTLQQEEVSEVRWLDFQDCLEKVQHNLIPHCIYPEELEMVRRACEPTV
jgi:isopentenyldiphosphate isomerase